MESSFNATFYSRAKLVIVTFVSYVVTCNVCHDFPKESISHFPNSNWSHSQGTMVLASLLDNAENASLNISKVNLQVDWK